MQPVFGPWRQRVRTRSVVQRLRGPADCWLRIHYALSRFRRRRSARRWVQLPVDRWGCFAASDSFRTGRRLRRSPRTGQSRARRVRHSLRGYRLAISMSERIRAKFRGSSAPWGLVTELAIISMSLCTFVVIGEARTEPIRGPGFRSSDDQSHRPIVDSLARARDCATHRPRCALGNGVDEISICSFLCCPCCCGPRHLARTRDCFDSAVLGGAVSGDR